VVGVSLGALGLLILGATPGVKGFLEPDLSPQLMLISIGIAVIVGVVSGLYPAWRSSRLSPSLALQS
jgi:putative ABC transport system permease protein